MKVGAALCDTPASTIEGDDTGLAVTVTVWSAVIVTVTGMGQDPAPVL